MDKLILISPSLSGSLSLSSSMSIGYGNYKDSAALGEAQSFLVLYGVGGGAGVVLSPLPYSKFTN